MRKATWKGLYNYITSQDAVPAYNDEYEKRLQDLFGDSSKIFSRDEKEIITRRWGQSKPIKVISEELDIPIWRVNYIHDDAVFKLRNNNILKDYILTGKMRDITADDAIGSLELKDATFRVLKRNHITTLDKLCSMTEKDLLRLNNVGVSRVREIKEALLKHDMSLKKEDLTGENNKSKANNASYELPDDENTSKVSNNIAIKDFNRYIKHFNDLLNNAPMLPKEKSQIRHKIKIFNLAIKALESQAKEALV